MCSYVSVNGEQENIDKYFYNPTIFRENNFKVTRLHVHRIRAFIREILEAMDHKFDLQNSTAEEIVSLTLSLLKMKTLLKVTLNELTIASIWLVTQKRGMSNINITKLVDLSKKKLKKKVMYKNILRILSRLRQYNNSFNPKLEIVKIVSTSLSKLMKNEVIKSKLKKIDKGEIKNEYFWLLKKEVINLLSNNSDFDFSGKSRVTLAAILIYVADKVISRKHGIKSIISAKALEGVTGVCQFTILRNYKKFFIQI